MSLSGPTLQLLTELIEQVTISARQPDFLKAANAIDRAKTELTQELVELERQQNKAAERQAEINAAVDG